MIPVILLTQTNVGNKELLMLYGERTEATIVDEIKRCQREGFRHSQRHVTRHYPVVSYHIGRLPYKSAVQNGDETPEWQVGDTIELMYSPAAPLMCIRRDNSLLIMPGLWLLASLVLLGCSYRSFRRWHHTRHDTYYLFEGTTI